ncbi:SDR family NAD(P)-dependent oxidoreductase [Mycolicibacterium psychrotolerans]|uniref:3-oxoacyl-ACP reductase n=1 Tax=Mycolicibacterium psychrotolerans TaxID=216929 RepID=A0A7I7MJW4_9MYCO|nr:SDR family oxidoreductase [Mycolicibacterium psychrotolerans]BBX71539.1 3-oxoacyl-ACP reductase [Mycolicibacterium psychrotolerans]
MRRAVVITGAAGGIGQALCERARADGYLAIGIDLRPSPVSDISYELDLRDSANVIRLSHQISEEFELKAVIHNAAAQPIGGAGQTPIAEWTDILRTNVIAVDALLSATIHNLASNEGSVVAISSVHARATTGGLTAYAATKAALEGWVRSAALDLGPKIRVNAVSPGAIDTAKLREGFQRWEGASVEDRMAALRSRTALERIGSPSDVAAAVSFLISEEATFISGTVITVDGGATARLGSE